MKTDPMDDLRAELMAVEPSPGFAAGVRERLEGQRRAWSPLTWSLACATAAVAVVAGAAYVVNRSEVAVPAVGGPVAQVLSPARVADPTPDPVPTPAANPAVPRPARVSVRPSAVVTAEAPAGPFMEVMTNQPEVIRRMRARLSGNAFLDPNAAGRVTEEITVDPIVVSEISVPAIGGGVIKQGARGVGTDESRRITK